MRLICPNCDAQYEVPDEVVPPEGRDVQCSNCGHTWFQQHPDVIAKEEEAAQQGPASDDLEERVAASEKVPPPPETEPHPGAERAPKAEPEAAVAAMFDETEDDDYDEDYEEDAQPPEAIPRRELDPGVADILREEAAREAQARSRDQSGLESQPDLGLDSPSEDEAARRAREARDRMARMRGEDLPEEPGAVETAAAAAAALGSRRDLLPDIEEINSTLRSSSDRADEYDDESVEESAASPARRRKGGFRRGFLYTVLLFVVLWLLYIYAPAIAKAVPAVDPLLSGYVAQVDAARTWLDGQVRNVLNWLDATAASQVN